MDTKKLKMHLEAALACLGGDEEMGEEVADTSPEGEDDDMPMKSMKMSMSKYKV